MAVQSHIDIRVSGNVTDLELVDQILYISTDKGTVEFCNTETHKVYKTIAIPRILDYRGDSIAAKIYDIDYDQSSKQLYIASQGQSGFSNVFVLHPLKGIRKIIDSSSKLMIKRIESFNRYLILGLLSNELLSFDLERDQIVYRTQISAYAFSDFCFSLSKKRCITTDESGEVHILNTLTGELIYTFGGENVDNVYQIDYKNNVIATAGQDRNLGVYFVKPESSYSIQSDFLIYSVGLSPSGKSLAYYANEENDVKVIDVKSKDVRAICSAHNAIVNTILFASENELYTAADEPVVYLWKLKEKN